MRRILIALIVPMWLGGCFAYHDSAPQRTTIVVPPGSIVTCADGRAPPC